MNVDSDANRDLTKRIKIPAGRWLEDDFRRNRRLTPKHTLCRLAACGDVAQRESTAFATSFKPSCTNNLRLPPNDFNLFRFLSLDLV